jgi:hypothetical protein
MGRIDAILSEQLMFSAEAGHKFDKPRILFEDRERFPTLKASERSSLLGLLSYAQQIATEAGVKLVMQQDGHIGGYH